MNRERRRTNRLARESSPYLLQHASNPVDWYPWGPEAFATARERDVPIFLSVGYSTCHWCHVMERESFENDAVARLMNERFVNVKLDREERPDVDELYMAAVQILTGRGGWPMSVFLEPLTLKPFWGGTYFPPEPAMGMPGFAQVLEAISAAWRNQRGDVLSQGEEVVRAVREHLSGDRPPVPIGIPQVAAAVSALLSTHDRLRGGFGGAPKFPQPVYLSLLLSFLPFAGEPESAAAAETALRLTLDRMALGGMHDQVGGGFHRYSVDAEWLVPHFEKMLYDNAQLAEVYARAAARFHDPFYERVARRTFDFVLREMTSPEGAFHSAQDADVDGREGASYLWTPEQVQAALPGEDAAFVLRLYGLDMGPNFRDPHHAEQPPGNVLRLDARPETLAVRFGTSPDELLSRVDRVNAALYAARVRRPQPTLDDKILAGWNGLMIGALSVGGSLLDEPRYLAAAQAAAEFVLRSMRTPDGGLVRSARGGKAGTSAFLEDYACALHGLVELRRAGGDARFLSAACELAEHAASRFGDGSGGFHDTLLDQADLFTRPRSTYDGAIPCGASVMTDALVDLHELTGDRRWLDAAGRALASISGAIAASPVATANSTRVLLRVLTLDGTLMSRLVPGTPVDRPATPRDFTPVVVFGLVERLTIRRDEPVTLALRLRIAEGYHIQAADPHPGAGPGAHGLEPLHVGVIGGGGVHAYADYPQGEPYGPGGSRRIHRGEIELPVVLERHGEWTGRPILTVSFQACTESECLAPATVELDVALDRGD
jgi:uncharacterized protein YyaL (SSP411 family)